MTPLFYLDAQKASSLYLTSTRVDEWMDANGSGKSLATSASLSTAYNPTYNSSLFGGNGGISFNGSQFLESAAAFPELNWKKGFTIFLAGQFKNGFYAAADSSAIILGAGLGTRLGMGTACNSFYGLPLVPCVFGFVWDGLNGHFIMNGKTHPIEQGSLSPGSAAFGKFQLGGIIGAAGSMVMDVAGLMVFDDELSSDDICSVSDQLSKKYQLDKIIEPKYNIVVDGNSLAAGYWSSDKTTMWDGVKGISDATPLDVVNASIGGIETLVMASRAPSVVDPMLNKSVPAKRRVLIVWEITNDLSNLTQTDTAAYNNIKAYCQARKTAGWKVIVCTCLPRTAPGINTNFETYRLSVNTSINANAVSEGWADHVADIGGDATIGATAASDNTIYYNDKIHLTSAGHNIAKTYITSALTSIL